jgi:ABC-type amino acid transport substrate-binding protein
MKSMRRSIGGWSVFLLFFLMSPGTPPARANSLDAVLAAGKLRHLGIVYANFITENQTGLDVELMRGFAAHLGVSYEFVETNWRNVLPDLTGKVAQPVGEDIEIVGSQPIRGDVVATGFTVLPWREKVVDFSETTFPTGVWLISRADAALKPIAPTGSISGDIDAVKRRLKGRSVLGLENSCLDPALYGLDQTEAEIKLFPIDRDLNEMIPAVLARMADTTLMDVPVALIALETWPGEIKVVGPVSAPQRMACAFSETAPELRKAFNAFFQGLQTDGRYRKMVEKYYPSVFTYFPEFLRETP